MSFDKRGRPVICHEQTSQTFLQNAKHHAVFDRFLFRPAATPVCVPSLSAAFETVCTRGTAPPITYVFSNAKTGVSGAIIASGLRLGSLQRIIVEDIVLASNPHRNHIFANTCVRWLLQREAFTEIVLSGIYNDGWRGSLIQNFDFKQTKTPMCISISNV